VLIPRNRRSLCPGEDSHSSPGRELLGAFTSQGPSPESYQPSGEASGGRAKAFRAPTPAAAVFAQGMRAPVSAATCAPAVLQRGVPASGAAVVGVEGWATMAGDGRGQTEAERAKPALSGAAEGAETSREESGSGTGEGHP